MKRVPQTHKTLFEKYQDLKEKLEALEQRIEEIQNDPLNCIAISDHALIRYFERCCGVDTNGMKLKIRESLSKEIIDAVKGTGKVVIDSVTYVLQDYTVVTIY